MVLIIIIIVSSYIYTDKITKSLMDDLQKNEKNFSKMDSEDLENEIYEILQTWEKNKKILAILVNHSVIDEIDYSFSQIKSAVKMRDFEGCCEKMALTRLKIEGIANLQKITISNLL